MFPGVGRVRVGERAEAHERYTKTPQFHGHCEGCRISQGKFKSLCASLDPSTDDGAKDESRREGSMVSATQQKG